MSIQRILVPVDGSEAALRALDFAGQLALALGASLDVVTVLSLGELDFYDGMYLTLDQVEGWQTQLKAEILTKATLRIPEGVRYQSEVLHGRIIPTRLERAASQGASMVVMGRTGKGRLEQVLKGSIAQRLSASAPLPVTLVS